MTAVVSGNWIVNHKPRTVAHTINRPSEKEVAA